MKVDKKKPEHWFILIWTALLILLFIPFRIFKRKGHAKTVVLYAHKLHGNINSIYEYTASKNSNLNIFYLSLDPTYYKEISNQHNILSAINPTHLFKVVMSEAIITDHGLHTLIILLKCTRIAFFDVWHGIPYKGFVPSNFHVQHLYNETWVSSLLLADLYTTKFNFSHHQVIPTGYGRTDLIQKYSTNKELLLTKYNIPQVSKIILFAPTWKQDQQGRSEIPFGLNQDDFLKRINDIGEETNSHFIIRYHLNSSVSEKQRYHNITHLPLKTFPNGEEIIAISDILITDWSSIAFDMMVLNKPILFIDVAPPFQNGFSLGAEFRVGELVKSFNELSESLHTFLIDEEYFFRKYGKRYEEVKKLVYDNTLDGKTVQRYLERLKQHI